MGDSKILTGRAHVFGDDVNTDYIISGRYKFKTLDMNELACHCMEDIDPDFASKVEPGDFIVAGANFGCGSSREQAPLVIKHAGVSAVLASSFARIFFRNAINKGLPVVECDTSQIEPGDDLEVDLSEGKVRNLTRGVEMDIAPLPSVMMDILADGGLTDYLRKHGGFKL
ncbi:MAG: 3-isopropylmalate dehydratase [Candidatus Solincola sediminis]|uniref:3-isopropylmalate dehydratase small subunit n=1 Tax=Candidatus Solincola sediminis TaxID=1797199 RepID=A0A1F2WH47_9ACTN|nr:MAG: 3-isopropylmalate dehydratase [Candidatus Solincola sediminis]OFW60422.1 MAG: 3-isopropylmalate dehydratase [Candidatus Solincola sediminis]